MQIPSTLQALTAATVGAFLLSSSPAALAQCPADDALEPNDDCTTAVAGPLSATGLAVTSTSEDFFTYTVNPGDAITLTASFIDAFGDIDLQLTTDTGVCSVVGAWSQSITDDETVLWGNTTAAPVTVTAHIFGFGTFTCANYDLTATFGPDPAQNPANDDAEEENDSCIAPSVPSANPLAGLFVSTLDEDYYTYTLMPGEGLDVTVDYENDDGDIDAQLILASDCATILDDANLSFTDGETLATSNATAAPIDVVLRIYVGENSARTSTTYNLLTAISSDPCAIGTDDAFEENDDCPSATPMMVGTNTGLFVYKETVDPDWYSIDVPDMATITVTANFINDDGDIDMDLVDACGGTFLEESAGIADAEDVTWTNTTGATVNVKWGIFVWDGDPTEDCNTYDMIVDVQGGAPTNIVPYCFGDGSGTACPCGNNSTAGHPGGCANSAGNGAILTATGNASVAMDTLNLDLASASLNSFALLVSGLNQLPQMGACIGCGLLAFDGLRCAGGGFLRHGSRATDANGETGNGWGPPGGPPGGLIAANGFAIGETRNFFAFYRDDPDFVCGTGQNSSNGVSVTFQP